MNRRSFCITCAALAGGILRPSGASGQEYIPLEQSVSCAVSSNVQIDGLWSFESSEEARDIVQKICRAVGLQQNFEIRAAAVGDGVANAAAFIRDPLTATPKRYIVYNERWVQAQLRSSGDAYWSGVGLLAHECGHHLNGDTLDNIGSRPPIELAADRFAGFVIARLGGSLGNAESLFRTLSEQGSATHPARLDRLQAVAVGWRDGSGSSNEACETTWTSEPFNSGGRLCRDAAVCVDGRTQLRRACQNSSGEWVWN